MQKIIYGKNKEIKYEWTVKSRPDDFDSSIGVCNFNSVIAFNDDYFTGENNFLNEKI